MFSPERESASQKNIVSPAEPALSIHPWVDNSSLPGRQVKFSFSPMASQGQILFQDAQPKDSWEMVLLLPKCHFSLLSSPPTNSAKGRQNITSAFCFGNDLLSLYHRSGHSYSYPPSALCSISWAVYQQAYELLNNVHCLDRKAPPLHRQTSSKCGKFVRSGLVSVSIHNYYHQLFSAYARYQ